MGFLQLPREVPLPSTSHTKSSPAMGMHTRHDRQGHSVAPSTHEPLEPVYRPKAVQELLRRWPHVPTRELQRIQRALIHCQQVQHPGNADELTGPAQALLDRVTAELGRRRSRDAHPSSARVENCKEERPHGRSL